MKPKDIFGLAVRLLGLLFLYYGLRAVMPLLDLELIENPDKTDIINTLMPVVFNLAVAWWLLGGGLARRAYPEPKTSDSAHPAERREPATIPTRTAQMASPQLTGMERAEQKLAALVDKPGEGRAT
ncbi:MAG TPA: hypothetical protein VH280_21755 [Verrucomicrobiae bacterium]|jgi:hypothetical protein|nr:hypothetical protein [Verrucomicrobiae bacterium]